MQPVAGNEPELVYVEVCVFVRPALGFGNGIS